MLTSKSDPYPIGRRFLSIVVVTDVLGGPTSLARAQGVRTGGDTLTQPVPTAGAQTAVPPSGQQATISSGSSCHGIPVRSTNRMPVTTARSGMRGRPARRPVRRCDFGTWGFESSS